MKADSLLTFFCTSYIIQSQSLFRTFIRPSSRNKAFPTFRAGASVPPRMEYDETPSRALILVDGFCPYHSGYLAARAIEYPGVAVIHLLSDYLRGYLETTQPQDDWECGRIPTEEESTEWKQLIGNLPIVAVYCESDSGLADAERLRQRLNVDCRDVPAFFEARRNKYLMNEQIRKDGMLAVQQQLCHSLEQAEEFATILLKENGKVIVKPIRGVASESVFLCTHVAEVEEAWNKITATLVFGSQQNHDSVLIQEFLQGTEYALDVVSRHGQHKVAAIWRYDKRPANGAPFCYFQTKLVDSTTDENCDLICNYTEKALNSLGVKHGLSHNEVILTSKGPTLVEVNCRQHNMDFGPLTMACIGYNALDMTLDALLGNEQDWDKYPERPLLRAAGCMTHLVNYQGGRLNAVHHINELNELPSVFNWEIYENFLTRGETIHPTIDIRSDAGWVQLLHDDPETLDSDYEKIVAWMPTMFQVD